MKALIIRPGSRPESIELKDPDNSDEIRTLVGNWCSTCFRIRAEGSLLIGYCDDEFLLRSVADKDWSCCLGKSLRLDAPYPIGGPVVIVGVNWEGESLPLTNEQISHFTLSNDKVQANPKLFGFGTGMPRVPELPLLEWEG